MSTDYATTTSSGSSTTACCSICNFEKLHLKTLPCSHLACVACLLQVWMTNEKPEEPVRCQICQFDFSIFADANPQLPQIEHVADPFVRSLKASEAPHYECCSGCGKSQTESDLLVCADCEREQHGFDLTGGQPSSEEIILSPLCGICAVRLHIRIGHVIMDYFPLRSAQQFQCFLQKQTKTRGKLEESLTTMKAQASKVEKMLKEANQNLDELTGKTRNAETSQQQYAFHREFEMITERMTKILSEMSLGMMDSVEEFEIELDGLRSSVAYNPPATMPYTWNNVQQSTYDSNFYKQGETSQEEN